MSKDLEDQLKELGTDCQAVVARLRAAKTVEPGAWGQGRRSRLAAAWLVAASLLIALAFAAHLSTTQPSRPSRPTFGAREYHQTIAEMVSTQRPDGSWQNDFLTRRNAEALSRCEGAAERIAYKKAVRNLRSKGIRFSDKVKVEG